MVRLAEATGAIHPSDLVAPSGPRRASRERGLDDLDAPHRLVLVAYLEGERVRSYGKASARLARRLDGAAG